MVSLGHEEMACESVTVHENKNMTTVVVKRPNRQFSSEELLTPVHVWYRGFEETMMITEIKFVLNFADEVILRDMDSLTAAFHV